MTKAKELCAANLLNKNHPVHGHFKSWVEAKDNGAKLTRRQARKFLQVFPKYRGVYEEIVTE